MSPPTVMTGLLIALAAAAPLPFGSVPEWAGGMLAGGIGALLAAWGALALRSSVPLVRPPAWFWLAAGLFLAALGWGVAQTLTGIPAAPYAFRWEGAAPVGPVALDPAAGRAAAVQIAACAGVFWLALQNGRDAKRAAWMFAALGFAAALHALYGLSAHLSGTNTILWFAKTAYHDVVTGTFVNRNTFATHAALGLLCLAAALRETFGDAPARTVPRRERFRWLVAEAPVRKALLLAAALLVGNAILLSESRAGAASALLGLTAFLAILALRARRRLLAAAAMAGVLGVGLLLATLGEGLERRLWTAEADWEERRQIAAETLDAIEAAPLRGVGLGGFEAAHRMHREAGGTGRIERAHNDYLQTTLELGCRVPCRFSRHSGSWRSPVPGARCGGGATPPFRPPGSRPAFWWARTPLWTSA